MNDQFFLSPLESDQWARGCPYHVPEANNQEFDGEKEKVILNRFYLGIIFIKNSNLAIQNTSKTITNLITSNNKNTLFLLHLRHKSITTFHSTHTSQNNITTQCCKQHNPNLIYPIILEVVVKTQIKVKYHSGSKKNLLYK